MKKYARPAVVALDDQNEGIYLASGAVASEADCLDVTWWEDNPDGATYRFVFKVTHKGHQSYGQTVTAQFSVPVTITETDGTVTYNMLPGNTVELVRDNQLNDNGLVELWVKVQAATHPTVINVLASNCVRK